MNRLFLNILVSLLLVALSLPTQAQLDPTPKGFKLLWKIPAYSCFDDLDIIRQTDSGAVFINAFTKYCETGRTGGIIGIWVDSKGDAVYMNSSPDRVNSEIIFISDNKIVFIESPSAVPGGTSKGKRIYLSEVSKDGGTVKTNLTVLEGDYWLKSQDSEIAANSNAGIVFSLKDNQAWSPFRWLYAYTVDSGAGSGGETGGGISQYIKIRSEPVDQYGVLGGSVEFKVDVASSIPVTYQWQKDSKDLAGATLSSLRVDKIATINSGVYTLIAKTALGSLTSAPAKLEVVSLPIVTFATNRVPGEYGKITTLSPTVISQGPSVYRWFKNGVLLAGEVNAYIEIVGVGESGSYNVECKNIAGSGMSKSVDFISAVIPPGKQKWESRGDGGFSSSPAIGSDGTVYVVSRGNKTWGGGGGSSQSKVYVGRGDGKVYALNGPTGIKKWEFLTGGSGSSSPAIGSDGTVYVGSDDGKVYALNGDTGSKKWEFLTGGSVVSSPAIGSDGTVYVGSLDKKVYTLNGTTGAKKWEFLTDGGVQYSSPAIGSDGTVYVGSLDGKLYALSGTTGAKKWEFLTGGSVEASPAIGSDGTVYVGSLDKKVYALNGTTGAKKWEFLTDGGIQYSSPAIGSDGTVYVGSLDRKLYALNGMTGAKKWEFLTGGSVESSPAIGSDGTVYVGSFDGKLYALNGTTGAKKWEFQTGDWLYSSPVYSSPAIGSDGTVYFGSLDEKVYAIASDSQGIARSPWPKFHANNQNTGKIASGFGPMTINYSSQSGLNLDIPVSPDFETILEYSTNLNQWSEQQRFGRQSNTPSIVVPLKMDQTKSMEYWRTRNQ